MLQYPSCWIRSLVCSFIPFSFEQWAIIYVVSMFQCQCIAHCDASKSKRWNEPNECVRHVNLFTFYSITMWFKRKYNKHTFYVCSVHTSLRNKPFVWRKWHKKWVNYMRPTGVKTLNAHVSLALSIGTLSLENND